MQRSYKVQSVRQTYPPTQHTLYYFGTGYTTNISTHAAYIVLLWHGIYDKHIHPRSTHCTTLARDIRQTYPPTQHTLYYFGTGYTTNISTHAAYIVLLWHGIYDKHIHPRSTHCTTLARDIRQTYPLTQRSTMYAAWVDMFVVYPVPK